MAQHAAARARRRHHRIIAFEGFDDLLLRLQGGGATRIQDAVIEAITTKETSFFRDSWLFDALLNNVLPDLAVSSKQRIRIWSAGTSTGQEAYSLAILALEFLDSRLSAIAQSQFNILASDISAEAIDAAKIGLYSKQEVERGLSDSRTRRFFQHQGDGWMIREALRPMVQFRVMNLLQPPTGVGPFDLVLCRNVLIYFDEPTRAQVCKAMHEMMRKGAWLALGSAEPVREYMERNQRFILYRLENPTSKH
jgi:chemotaxis protein methyltransferase CheR